MYYLLRRAYWRLSDGCANLLAWSIGLVVIVGEWLLKQCKQALFRARRFASLEHGFMSTKDGLRHTADRTRATRWMVTFGLGLIFASYLTISLILTIWGLSRMYDLVIMLYGAICVCLATMTFVNALRLVHYTIMDAMQRHAEASAGLGKGLGNQIEDWANSPFGR